MGKTGAGGAGQWIAHLRRQINLKALDSETQRPVSLIVAGARREECCREILSAGPARDGALIVRETLTEPAESRDVPAKAALYCPEAENTNGALSDIASLPYAVFVVRMGASPADEGRLATAAPQTRPAPGSAAVYYVRSLQLAELRKYVLPDIVRIYRDHEIALAAAIPAFRPVVAAKLTADCAMTSLKVAAASAVADHIPVLGLITGGIASAGDTIAITALQMRMLLRIAAAYGKKPEIARMVELLPVVGGGYGWRTLAREASGFIPVAGIPIKAAIAYAGTLVVGQVAAHYYETGLRMPTSAVGAVYREASERAKKFVRLITDSRGRQ